MYPHFFGIDCRYYPATFASFPRLLRFNCQNLFGTLFLHHPENSHRSSFHHHFRFWILVGAGFGMEHRDWESIGHGLRNSCRHLRIERKISSSCCFFEPPLLYLSHLQTFFDHQLLLRWNGSLNHPHWCPHKKHPHLDHWSQFYSSNRNQLLRCHW